MTTQADILGIPPRMNHNRPASEPENLLPAVRDVPLIPARAMKRYAPGEAELLSKHFAACYAMERAEKDRMAKKIGKIEQGEREKRYDEISKITSGGPVSFETICEETGLAPKSVSSLVRSMRDAGKLFAVGDGRVKQYTSENIVPTQERATIDDLDERCRNVLALLSTPRKFGYLRDALGLTRPKLDVALQRLLRDEKIYTTRPEVGSFFWYHRA